MKAFEFPVKVLRGGKIQLPEHVLKQLPGDGVVRVIVLLNEPGDREEGEAWSRLAAQQFLSGYAAADAVYDTI
ncbi:MAG: hypothetical protein HPY83_18190 [Anaerolineae bacterium]|nr:hypothetical protein [Anaerolineae bacterium]